VLERIKMELSDYSFGEIKIDGKKHTSDFIVYEDIVIPNWRREKGHNLSIKDLEKTPFFTINVIDIDRIIIGTGKNGMMKVPEETIKYLEDKEIEVGVYSTVEAVEKFNKFNRRRIVLVGYFHLTC